MPDRLQDVLRSFLPQNPNPSGERAVLPPGSENDDALTRAMAFLAGALGLKESEPGKTWSGAGAMVGAAVPFLGPASRAIKGASSIGRAESVLPAAERMLSLEGRVAPDAMTARTTGRGVSGVVETPVPSKLSGKRIESGDQAGVHHGTKAFGGISPQRLVAIKKKYLKAVEEGKDFRGWYDDVRKEIEALVGGDSKRAREVANMIAETSAGTEIGVNTGFAIRANNQAAVGAPINTGRYPERMSAAIEQILADERQGTTGLKRSAFANNMDPTVDPIAGDARATHDIRYVRGLGIPDPKTGEPWSKGISPAGHEFLDRIDTDMLQTAQAQELGGVKDWTKPRMQAAAWISQKANQNKTSLAEAAKSPNDFFNEFSSVIASEAAPGTGLGIAPEFGSASPEQRAEYSRRVLDAMKNMFGRDEVATKMGALTRETIPQVGSYTDPVTGELLTNAGSASPILTARSTGTPTTDPQSSELARAIASLEGLLLGQNQMGVTSIGRAGAAKVGDFNSALIDVGRPLSDIEQQSLATLTSGNPVVKHPAGAVALNFDDVAAPGTEGYKGRGGLLETLRNFAEKIGGEARPSYNTGELVPGEAAVAGGGRWASAYLDNLPPGSKLAQSADSILRESGGVVDRVSAAIESASKEFGWTQAPWYRTMIEAGKSGGIEAVRELARKGVIPALVMSVLSQKGLDNGGVQ